MSPVMAKGQARLEPAGALRIALQCSAGIADIMSAFAPTVRAHGDKNDLALRFFTGALSDAAYADPEWDVASCLARGQTVRVRTPKGRRYFDPETRTLAMLEGDVGTLVFENPAILPPWVLAAPGLRVIDWWSTARGMLATHACAMVVDGKAVLCVGPSGSGKSTLSVEAALAGHGFLGDDYVLVDPRAVPGAVHVHPLYRSAKLMPKRLPVGLDQKPWLFADEAEHKHVYLMPESRCHGSAAVVAVVAPHLAYAEVPELREARAPDMMRYVAPSILRQLAGEEQQKLATLARIVSALPCYTLGLARDGQRNLAALADLVTRSAGIVA